MENKLIICDLDGTLFDTRGVNYHAYKQALREFGFETELTYEYYIEHLWGPIYKHFLPELGVPENLLEPIHDRKMELYDTYIKYAVENRSLFTLLEALKTTGEYKIVVVTAGSKNAYFILEYFGRANFFDRVYTSNDVDYPKPHPEGFLKAMADFQASPINTIIFEDSATGIEAARATGAAVMVVDDFGVDG